MALYSGLAEGGPYAGKPIHHGLQTLKVARNKLSNKVVTWNGPATEEIRIDEYRYQRGRWVWREK